MWVKLDRGSDWGATRYWYPGERVPPDCLTQDGNAALALERGQRVKVRFPDGYELETELAERREQSSVSDHGSRYDFMNSTFGVIVEVHGLGVYVPITAVEVEQGVFKRKREER